MPRLVIQLLQDILDETEFLISQSSINTKDQFLCDPVARRAFVRSIEIIGEATKKVPDEIRVISAAIPWRLMAGMRDRLIHDYAGVDYKVVWDVATKEAPDISARIRALLQSLDSNDQNKDEQGAGGNAE